MIDEFEVLAPDEDLVACWRERFFQTEELRLRRRIVISF